jgi:hypothetical protein
MALPIMIEEPIEETYRKEGWRDVKLSIGRYQRLGRETIGLFVEIPSMKVEFKVSIKKCLPLIMKGDLQTAAKEIYSSIQKSALEFGCYLHVDIADTIEEMLGEYKSKVSEQLTSP